MGNRKKSRTGGSRGPKAARAGSGTSALGRAVASGWLAIPTLLLLAFGFVEMAPYVDKITKANSGGEDWLSYKTNAIQILHDGILMPGLQRVYARPAGFLYNYFVAAIFAIAGINDTIVVFVQLLLVGVGTVVMYFAFREELGRGLAVLYFLLLTALFLWERAFFETLLSETLLIILLPWLFFFLLRGFHARNRRDVAIAGFIAGLCLLTRPNVGMIIPAFALLLFLYLRGEPRRIFLPLLFCVAATVPQLFLIGRNIAATHKVTIGTFNPAFAVTRDWAGVHNVPLSETLTSRRAGSLRTYLARVAICFGYVSDEHDYEIVVHWIAMWLGVLVYVISMFMMHRRPGFDEGALIAFIAAYLVPAVLFSQLTNYSGRMVVPVLGAVLALSVLGLRRFSEMRRTRRAAAA